MARKAERQITGQLPVFQEGSKEGHVCHEFMLKARREQNQKSFISAGLLALKKTDARKGRKYTCLLCKAIGSTVVM